MKRLNAPLLFSLLLVVMAKSSSFNATDLKYQVKAKFPPDKTSTWTYGIEHDGWWIAHEALRGELKDMQEILDHHSVALESPTRQQAVLALEKWWKGHLNHMHSHHRNEDKVARTFASRRFQWPDFLDIDHDDILQRLETINSLIQRISKSESSEITSLIHELRTVWSDYHDTTVQHLAEEERVCIPLMRAYFTQQQVQKMQQRLAMLGPRVEAGGIVYYVGEDRMKESMMKQKTPKLMQIIGWNLILKPRFKYYTKTMVKQLEILRKEL